MKHLKNFELTSEYNSFVDGNEFIMPNVSYVKDDDKVYYHALVVRNNIITYQADSKLSETTSSGSASGLHVNAFNSSMVSHEFADGIGTITFEEDVTSIGQYAFYYCTGLTSIIIPDSVTEIGSEAFEDCSGLTELTIGSGVTSIGNSTFANCTSLTSINIPDGVTSIGHDAFVNCSGLTSINIPGSVTTIDDEAFMNCSGLTEVTIGSGVTKIGTYAFAWCTGLTSINIPNSVKTIGRSAFYECLGLTSMVIPNSVTSIGESAFAYCNMLTSINIPGSVTSIGERAFSGCSGLTEITIPDSVTEINTSAFSNCSSLSSITVSSGNPKYDSRENCNCIIETETNTLINGCNSSFIPNTVTSIGYGAFESCEGLTSIVIPDSVTEIGDRALWYCTGLTSITCHATTAPSIQYNTFSGIHSNGILYVPAGCTNKYSSWMSTSDYYLGKYNWAIQENYVPTECTSLTITANDVTGRATSTTIHYTAVTNGINPINGNPITGVIITGTATSAEFPQNTSETDTVQRTITFEYMGKTASTTITQGIWVNQGYTVDLNDQWQLSSEIPNPDSAAYDGVYESFSNKGVDNSAAFMYIDIVGYENFKFYVRSDAESFCDYLVVSNLDCKLEGDTPVNCIKYSTEETQNSGTAIHNYTLVEFTGIDGGEHRITVMYRKDSGVNSGTDQGYVLIPYNQDTNDEGYYE